jgi:hypothetical protein
VHDCYRGCGGTALGRLKQSRLKQSRLKCNAGMTNVLARCAIRHSGRSRRGSTTDLLLPGHCRTIEPLRDGDLVLGRQLLFTNDDVRISAVTVGDTPRILPLFQ